LADRLNDLDGKNWLQYSFSIWRDIKKSSLDYGNVHPASFPVELPSRLIRIYTHEGDTVMDPFMGSGSTIVAALIEKRSGIGVELSDMYYSVVKKRLEALSLEKLSNPPTKSEIYNSNALEISKLIKEESVDLCVTSPPYWDILNRKRSADRKETINYSDSPDDFGNISDYHSFLESLKKVFFEVHKVLKKGGYCAIIVMDIRKGGSFYPFHSDISTMMLSLNYEMKDIIIWDRQKEYNNMRPLGYPYSFVVNKVHEYILLFEKVK